MSRRPAPSHLADLIRDLQAQLKVADKVLPVLAEQARLELRELTGRHPTSERGADYSSDPPPHYSDPTGEQVVNFRSARDGACDPAEDLERIAQFMSAGQHLLGALRRLLTNAPAVTLAVVDGRRPTDGRSAEEHAQRKFVRVLAGERCLIGQDHDDTDRFGPGQLRRGLCNRHRMALERWCAQQPVLPLERAEQLVRWQKDTFGRVFGERVEEQPEGPYKANLREVA